MQLSSLRFKLTFGVALFVAISISVMTGVGWYSMSRNNDSATTALSKSMQQQAAALAQAVAVFRTGAVDPVSHAPATAPAAAPRRPSSPAPRPTAVKAAPTRQAPLPQPRAAAARPSLERPGKPSPTNDSGDWETF